MRIWKGGCYEVLCRFVRILVICELAVEVCSCFHVSCSFGLRYVLDVFMYPYNGIMGK